MLGFFSLAFVWRVIADAREVKKVFDERSELTPSERADRLLQIAEHWAAKTDFTLDDEMVRVCKEITPMLNPFWTGIEKHDGELVWDTSVDILAMVAPLTEGEMDDRLLPYAKSPMVREIAAAVLNRVLAGEDDVQVLADCMVAADQSEGFCGPAGNFGNGDKHGNPAMIIGAISLILQVIKFIRDRKKG